MKYIIDGHIHFNKQPYTLETINKMVEVAIKNNINELWLLDHTHKFYEFQFLYRGLKDDISISWFNKKDFISINEYLDFVKLVKSKTWPIKLKFGLEVCYFEEAEDELKEYLKTLPLDFYIGSIHFIDGIMIDYNKELQELLDKDHMYKEYFRLEERMANSHIFTSIGHPDCIRLYGIYPSGNLFEELIESFAKCLAKNNQITENNTGLARFGFTDIGLSKTSLKYFKKYGVKYHKSSDAHYFEDIGRIFDSIDSSY